MLMDGIFKFSSEIEVRKPLNKNEGVYMSKYDVRRNRPNAGQVDSADFGIFFSGIEEVDDQRSERPAG